MPMPSFKDILMKGVKTNKDEALRSGKHDLRRKTLSSFLGQDVGELVRHATIYARDRYYCGPGRLSSLH